MTRELLAVDGRDASAVLAALRDALAGGPAVFPLAAPTSRAATPSDAEQSQALPPTVPQRVALVVQTSGSTGRPKRVALGADALLASAAASDSALGGPGQWLLALPTHYIAGVNVLVRSLASQTEPVIMSADHFDAFSFAVAADRMDASERAFVSLVPAQLSRLIESDDVLETLRNFEAILVGGQSMPQELLKRSLELGLNVTRTYGSSETSGGCVYDGIPLAGVRAEVVDGQIELTGPMLAEGYLGDERATDAAFSVRGGIRWYRTGDTGEMADGVVAVTGRIDDVIISGGVKVSLAVVERIVRSLPGLGDAIVVAGQSAGWGQVPVVFALAPTDLSAIRAAVEEQAGKAARPDAVHIVDEFPVLASGKPDRLALQSLVTRGQNGVAP